MEFQRLKENYHRVYAADAITVRPIPLDRPCIVADVPSEPSLGTEPMSFCLKIRNVGSEACELMAIQSSVEGIRFVDFVAGQILRANMLQSEAIKCPYEIQPFYLSDGITEAKIEFIARSTRNGDQVSSATRLRWQKVSSAGPVFLSDARQVSFSIRVNNLFLFECDGDGAREVLLHVEDGPEKDVYPMLRRDDSKFVIALQLKDGTYRDYRFCIDGTFRNDKRVADQAYVPGVSTPCSRLDLPIVCDQIVNVRNPSDYGLRIAAEVNAPWIDVTPKKLSIASRGSARLNISVDPALLSAGTHSTVVRFAINAIDPLEAVREIPIHVVVVAPGPVPLASESYDLGTVYEGVDNKCNIQLRNIGSGTLRGTLKSDDPFVSSAQFTVDDRGSVDIPLVIHPEPKAGEKGRTFTSSAVISCNTPVHKRREFQVGLRYRVQGMRFEPADIDVGTISPGETRAFSVQALRGDGSSFQDVRLNSAPDWLQLTSSDKSGVKVTVNGDGFSVSREDPDPDRSFRGELSFRDSQTGAVGTLPIHGEFAVPRAQAGQLDFGRLSRKERKQLPVPLLNHGTGTLIINGVMLDQNWITVKPWEESGQASLIAYVGGWDFSVPSGRHEGVIEIATNDPRSAILKVPFKLRLTD
jgi:hypothetical protein